MFPGSEIRPDDSTRSEDRIGSGINLILVIAVGRLLHRIQTTPMPIGFPTMEHATQTVFFIAAQE